MAQRRYVRAFLAREAPRFTVDAGVDMMQLLMAGYQGAEQEHTLAFPPVGLEAFVAAVARREWRG